MSGRHVSLVTKGRLAELARLGLSTRALARELGVHHKTIARWIDEGGIETPTPPAPTISPAALVAAFAPEQQTCLHSHFTGAAGNYRCLDCDAVLHEAPVAPRPVRTGEEPRRSWADERESMFSTGPIQISQPSYGNIMPGRREKAPTWTVWQHR